MLRQLSLITGLMVVAALPAMADYARVQSEADFVNLISGKTLTRPLVKLRVSPSGEISGKGVSWSVHGKWQWKKGYFCRTLEWGGDDLGYNCQEVMASGSRIRFTSDQGQGDSAEFSLR